MNTEHGGHSAVVQLPPFPSANGQRGRGTKERQDRYRAFTEALAAVMRAQYKAGVRWSTRGWCYALEEVGLGKNDFDAAENIIVKLRKDGMIPLDAVLEDQAREWSGFEYLDHENIEDEATGILEAINRNIRNYQPVSFWDLQDCYVCMAVEKRDLIGIFEPVCREYYIPIANFRGSPDLLSRGRVLLEFMKHWEAGRRVVVLYCGDHDPAGLRMSGDEMTSNFAALHGTQLQGHALYFNHGLFAVDRFGLNADFIEEAGLSWTPNLLTGQKDKSKPQDLADPAHNDHRKAYVQDYLHRFGARKVEANALVVRKEMGRTLCRSAIERYIDPASVDEFEQSLKPLRKALRGEVSKQLLEFEVSGDEESEGVEP